MFWAQAVNLGRQVVRQASARGHDLTAFVRRPPSPAFGPSIRVQIGDAMRQDEVCAALAGQQAVVNTIGGGTLRPNQIVPRTTAVAVAAAQSMHVTHHIAMSSFLVTVDWPIFRYVLIPLIYRNVTAGQRCTEQLVTASSLDWTIVRPSRLTNWTASGYALSMEQPSSFFVSLQDVAAFIVDELDRDAHIREALFVGAHKALTARPSIIDEIREEFKRGLMPYRSLGSEGPDASAMSLLIRNLLFTIIVPGLGGVWIPWRILTRGAATPEPVTWPAVALIAVGAALYFWCLSVFAIVGRGTPGPWDAPRRVVAAGPYRWVRNPIYIAALLVVVGESWLFLSPPLLVYAGAVAIFAHLFVIGYEEPTLRRRFGETYVEYLRTVPRWIPRPPKRG